jgi:hypothetical protein
MELFEIPVGVISTGQDKVTGEQRAALLKET